MTEYLRVNGPPLFLYNHIIAKGFISIQYVYTSNGCLRMSAYANEALIGDGSLNVIGADEANDRRNIKTFLAQHKHTLRIVGIVLGL